MNTLSFASRFRTAAILAAFSDRDGAPPDRARKADTKLAGSRQAHLRLRAMLRLAGVVLRRRLRGPSAAYPRSHLSAAQAGTDHLHWGSQGFAPVPKRAVPAQPHALASHFAFSDVLEPTHGGQ